MKTAIKSIAIIVLALLIACSDSFGQDHPCKAITKAGTACRMPAKKGTTFCMTHDPAAIKCGFIKNDGDPCKMKVKKTGDRCRFHKA